MYWGHRRLMLPWLFIQGFLAAILAALASYYIILFPIQSSCIESKSHPSSIAKRLLRPPSLISSSSFEEEQQIQLQGGTNCTALLWYGAIMILSLLILIYYFYIVNVSGPYYLIN
jgi:hypothetical protein